MIYINTCKRSLLKRFFRFRWWKKSLYWSLKEFSDSEMLGKTNKGMEFPYLQPFTLFSVNVCENSNQIVTCHQCVFNTTATVTCNWLNTRFIDFCQMNQQGRKAKTIFKIIKCASVKKTQFFSIQILWFKLWFLVRRGFLCYQNFW